jgi:hypothetical protein
LKDAIARRNKTEVPNGKTGIPIRNTTKDIEKAKDLF